MRPVTIELYIPLCVESLTKKVAIYIRSHGDTVTTKVAFYIQLSLVTIASKKAIFFIVLPEAIFKQSVIILARIIFFSQPYAWENADSNVSI